MHSVVFLANTIIKNRQETKIYQVIWKFWSPCTIESITIDNIQTNLDDILFAFSVTLFFGSLFCLK